MSHQTVAAPAAGLTLRPAEPKDTGAVARIVFEAFAGIHDRHRFARDFPTLEAAEGLASAFIAHPAIWGVVAEIDGRVVGSNFLDERGPVRGVGPITVDPSAQAAGVGRRLMQAVLERGAGAQGIRLLQDAFNTRSMALYTALGFDVREPVVLLGGRHAGPAPADVEVRALQESDVEAAAGLIHEVLGFGRTAELRDALAAPHLQPVVALRDGRPVAVASSLTFFAAAFSVAEREEDLAALVAGGLALSDEPASFLLASRQSGLLRTFLDAGLQIVKPMTYMTVGDYREPRGAWGPSVLL